MDTLTSINVFRQVVESGSFVGAADRLDLMHKFQVLQIQTRPKIEMPHH
jgi:hypothetical protein